MKEQLFKKVGYDSSDLNYPIFDMKETIIHRSSWLLAFHLRMKIVIFDHLMMTIAKKKDTYWTMNCSPLADYLRGARETTAWLSLREGKPDKQSEALFLSS